MHHDHQREKWDCCNGTLIGHVAKDDLKTLLELKEQMWNIHEVLVDMCCGFKKPEESTPTRRR